MRAQPAEAPETSESGRDEVRRMLNLTERQLKAWEKQGFIAAAETFGFSDLLALKTLKKLRDFQIAPRQIRLALASLRKTLNDVDQPLSQLRITAEGRHIAVHVSGNKMEPISGQLLFDFDAREIEKLKSFPRAAGALVNLGTILFRMRKLADAEDYYLRAVQADPDYPLAHFNLGNLHDEQGRAEEARRYYLSAIRLNPRYADAYFNLALLCERNNQVLQAIGYWQAYLKLDSSSSWARAARKQLDRLKQTVRTK